MVSFTKFLIIEQQIVNLEDTLRQRGYNDLKIISLNKIAVLTDDNRQEVMDKLLDSLAEFNPIKSDATNHSSMGHIEISPNYKIIVKPKSKQGKSAAGVSNELKVLETINQYINQMQENITVIFKSNKKEFKCENVKEAIETGRTAAKGDKADIVLKGDKKYRISIKEDSAENWSAADKTHLKEAGKIIKDLVAQDKVKLIKKQGYFKLSSNIAKKATPEESQKFIFGNDLKEGEGAVITKTFKESDFDFDDATNTLTINCTSIIENLNDVTDEKQVYILIRNDSRRNLKSDLPGIRVVAVYKKRVKSTKVIKVS